MPIHRTKTNATEASIIGSTADGITLLTSDKSVQQAHIGGSGLDADTVDGQHASEFAASSHNHDASYIAKSLVDAKGDLLVGTADNTVGRLAVGANDSFPVADSGESTGLEFRTFSGDYKFHNGILVKVPEMRDDLASTYYEIDYTSDWTDFFADGSVPSTTSTPGGASSTVWEKENFGTTALRELSGRPGLIMDVPSPGAVIQMRNLYKTLPSTTNWFIWTEATVGQLLGDTANNPSAYFGVHSTTAQDWWGLALTEDSWTTWYGSIDVLNTGGSFTQIWSRSTGMAQPRCWFAIEKRNTIFVRYYAMPGDRRWRLIDSVAVGSYNRLWLCGTNYGSGQPGIVEWGGIYHSTRT